MPVDRSFWFWFAAIWPLLMAIAVRPRLREAVRHGQVAPDEAAAFTFGLTGIMVVLAIVLGTMFLAVSGAGSYAMRRTMDLAPFCQ